jgi:hypothetical protein
MFLYDTKDKLFSYKNAIVNSNEIILEMRVSNMETIYKHAKILVHQFTFHTAIGTQKFCQQLLTMVNILKIQ